MTVTRTALIVNVLAAASLAMLVAGCATSANAAGPLYSQPKQEQVAQKHDPPPKVENCGIVAVGSPMKFACDGKVYTSFQLAHLRQGKETSSK